MGKNNKKDKKLSYEMKSCKELSETAEKYRETIEFLDDLPDKVLQNIIDTKDNCDERGDKSSASLMLTQSTSKRLNLAIRASLITSLACASISFL